MTTGKKIALGLGCTIPLLCCVGGVVTIQATVGKAAGQLDHQLAEAKREGIPLEPADLDAMLKAKPEENAAPIYRKVLRQMEQGKPAAKAFGAFEKALGSNPKPEAIDPADRALTELAPLLAQAETATRLPHCVWGRDWSQGMHLLFPEFAPMRSLAKAFSYRAERLSAEGDWQGALRSLRAAQAIGRHAGEDPSIISMLVSVACQSIAYRSLQRIVEQNAKNPRFLAEARKLTADFGPLPDIRRAFAGEVVMGRIAIRQIKSTRDFMPDPSGSEPSSLEKAVFSSGLVKNAFEAKYVEAYRTLIGGLPKDPENWQKAEQACQEADKRVTSDRSAANYLNQMMFPVFSGAAQAIGRLQMNRRMTETTLRLLQERARTGAFPDRLPNYGPVRIDPFSGDPLHYGRVGKGFRLYSVGTDRTDDDGKAAEPGRTTENHDEVIIIK